VVRRRKLNVLGVVRFLRSVKDILCLASLSLSLSFFFFFCFFSRIFFGLLRMVSLFEEVMYVLV
jgi:hypothetical protein